MRLSQINAGVVGVGFIGVAHVEALRRLGINVKGVVGSTPERARAKADAADLPDVYSSIEALAADPGIDVIHITSPNYAHADQVRICLNAGKHVVCEKPLALSSQDTSDLLSLAASSGLVNAVCFNLRFYPNCHEAMAVVAAGGIGQPTFITGSYLQDWLLKDTDWNWRLVADEGGALRAVADIGSHWIDLSQFISGRKITEVMADLHTFVDVRRHPAGPVETFSTDSASEDLIDERMTSDDAASILLRFEDGARGLVAVSQVSAGRKNSVSIEVDGSESSLSWFSENPDQLWLGHRDRPNEIAQRDPSLASPEAASIIGYPAGHVEGYADTFRALFQQIYTDVAAGAPATDPTYPTFEDGHDVVLVTEAVARSAQEERWVDVQR